MPRTAPLTAASLRHHHNGGAGLVPTSAALTIISTAVRQRLLLDSWRKSMLAREATAPSVRELQNWLRVNPHPSIDTLRAFRDGRLMDHLRMVMPGNPAGRKQLDRFLDLLR